MDSKETPGTDRDTARSGEAGMDVVDTASIGKRKYVRPRCHCLMTGETRASKTSAPLESSGSLPSIGTS